MDLILIGLIVVLGINIFGKSKYQSAMNVLSTSQRETALFINRKAKKGHSIVGYTLLILLIIGLFIRNEMSLQFFLIFFIYSLVSHLIYQFRSKKLLSLSELPQNFINDVTRTDNFFLYGYLFIIVVLVIKIMWWQNIRL